MPLRFLFILGVFLYIHAGAQTLGGNAAYNFLKLPATPLLTAAGGVNISYVTDEAGLSANNPALLDSAMDTQVNLAFNSFLAGIKTYGLTGIKHIKKLNMEAGAHIYFVDYGTIPQTDAAGNQMGSFHPVDYVMQVAAAKTYLEKWKLGLALKLIHSGYQQFTSTSLAVDAGILYHDEEHLFSASVLMRNMGFQISTYAGEREDLPFDFQLGVTKRLSKAPFGFSVTAQHVHRFDILYNDTTFNNQNNYSVQHQFISKLINHLVAAVHIYAGSYLEGTIGYNQLRRTELNEGETGKGLIGFSAGLRIKLQKLQVLYARSSYQRNISFNQIGITLQLSQFFSPGKL